QRLRRRLASRYRGAHRTEARAPQDHRLPACGWRRIAVESGRGNQRTILVRGDRVLSCQEEARRVIFYHRRDCIADAARVSDGDGRGSHWNVGRLYIDLRRADVVNVSRFTADRDADSIERGRRSVLEILAGPCSRSRAEIPALDRHPG